MRDVLPPLRNPEFIILGMLSRAPQTRYGLRLSLNMRSELVRSSLSKLEEGRLIAASIEQAHWIYSITPLGQTALDAWIRSPFTNSEILRRREILMIKFLFAEGRLSSAELLDWLTEYQTQLEVTERLYSLWQDLDDGILSLHQQLMMAASHMEIEMQRAWIEKARARLCAAASISPALAAVSGK
jgi:DNA-binding PadR family transcriptional regulator